MLVPASGHPAHIDIRIGRCKQARQAIRRAVIADARKRKGPQPIAVDQRFRAAWKHAGIPITSSCLCVKHVAK